MSDYTIAYIVLFIIGLGVLAVFGAFGLWRKNKAYIVTVMRNYTNPQAGPKTYYAIVDTPAKAIRCYKTLWSFKATKNIPIFNINAFADRAKRVQVVTGVSGKPNDDMWVPMGLTVLSQAAALEYAKNLSDNVTANLDFYHELSKYDFRVGEKVEYTTKKKKGREGRVISAVIRAITPEGVIISYDHTFMDEDNKEQTEKKNVLIDKTNFGALSSDMDSKEKLKLPEFGYSELFTAAWIMKIMGVRKVEDANIVTIPQKTAVASLASRANEFVTDRAGFLEKHSGVIIGCLIMVFMGLTALFIFYGANTFYTGITQNIHSFIAGTSSTTTTTNITSIIPKSVTGGT